MKNFTYNFNRLQHSVIADKKVLVAWDYDERLYKKLHFLSGDVLKKHKIPVMELKSPWPHISAAMVAAPMSTEEREKFKLAAGVIKPKFVFKDFEILVGQQTPYDYLSVEFQLPKEFEQFLKFAQDICGVDRVVTYAENKPHLSLWMLERKNHDAVKAVLPEIYQATKSWLRPFTPTKVSIWDDFEISEIESIGTLQIGFSWRRMIKEKYKIVAESVRLTDLKKVLSTEEAYAILDRGIDGADTWLSGGCYLLAKTLMKILPNAELKILMGLTKEQIASGETKPQPEHALIRAGNYFIDGDGLSTEKTFLAV